MSGELSGQSIGVVGGGIGGLSAASYLAAEGADVTLYEQHENVGGVAGRIEADGFRFDTGPSWYLMPELFERFFAHFDSEPSDWYELVRLDPNYRVIWTDGDRADIPADPEQAKAVFESREPGAGYALEQYLEQAAETYELGMERFVMANRSRIRDYVALDVMRSGRAIKFLGTMDEHVSSYFENPKLKQLVEYTLVFLGGSPYNTPALYTLMSHVDYNLGVYYPIGGMMTVVDAMESVATLQGATIHTNTPVTAIVPDGEGVTVTADGTAHRHDRVISNAPPAYTEQKLLPDGTTDRKASYWDERTLSPSAFMLYLGVEGEIEELEHHSLVLPTDWKPHFDAIFEEPAWPERPSYYVNVPSQTDPTVAPDGCETAVVLVPLAPGLDETEAKRDEFRNQILSDLATQAGVDLRDRIRFEERACVSTYQNRFNKQQGTALGLAHTIKQTGPLRPGHRIPGVERVYLTGGSANPGIGVPMCLLSGEHVTEAVIEDSSKSGLLPSFR